MNKILYGLFVIAVIGLPISVLHAKAKIRCNPREPKIDYRQAIDIARQKSKTFYPANGAFIDLVKLSCGEKEHFWVVGFRRVAYESGHLLVYVYMNRSTKVTVVKDR